MCSLLLTHPSAHTWSSGQLTLRRPGSSWGFGALLKGLISVMDNSCRSRDSNPQPRVTSTTLYPLEPGLPPNTGEIHKEWTEAGVHFPAEFSSNPNQTHLGMLISVFRIIRKSQVGEFDKGWS